MKIKNQIKEVNLTAENLGSAENLNNIQTLFMYWNIIKIALNFVKIFTNSKADKKIDEVINWGDNINTTNK